MLVDTLAEEMIIVSYDFNKQIPIIFSKYSALNKPDLFNVSLSNAT